MLRAWHIPMFLATVDSLAGLEAWMLVCSLYSQRIGDVSPTSCARLELHNRYRLADA